MVTWPAMCRLGAARFHKPNGVLELVEAYSRQLPSQPRLGQHRKRSFEGVMTSAKPWLQLGNLPIDSTSFVGRRRELSEARRLLGDARLLTLTGVGGVGKTRLALRLAADVRRTFPDGVWLADLAELRDGELVPQTVIAALGLRDDSPRLPGDTLLEYLADKQLLLVLDNCEHLRDACAVLAAKLLSHAEGLRILATSRQLLNVQGEQVLEVPPLSIPDRDWHSAAGSLIEYEAVRLFAERAAGVVPSFAITPDNGPVVARLCQGLDGIPLAIELAAARSRVLSAEQILERLDDRYRLLTGGSQTALERHQTLRAAMEWSHELCSPQEQILWARLSVFAGGFDLEAVEQTCADEDIAQQDVFQLVTGLVDKSILDREEHGSRVRYRLLETIRQYGQTHLTESGQGRSLRRRHRDYYHDLAVRADAAVMSPRQTEWLLRLRPDLANIRVALESCLTEPGHAQAGLQIASALQYYWLFHGLLREARQWLTRALELDPRPTVIRSKALSTTAFVVLLQGDIDAALPLRDEGNALAQRLHDERALAHAIHICGMTAWAQGDLHCAIPLLTDALERSRTAGDDPTETFIDQLFLAMTTALLGDARSAACSAETLKAAQSAGAEWSIAWAKWVVGLHHWSQGDNRQATALFQDALRLHRTFSNEWGYAWCIEALAWTAANDAHYERAARLLGATLACLRAIGGMGGFKLFAAAHGQCETQLRHALGDDAYAAAVQRGTDLSLDQAIAYALGDQATTRGLGLPLTRAPGALTRRERQVADLIAEGLSNKQIATKLVIAPRTAEGHVEHILTKLGFNSRTQIATWAADRERP
jgi:non-specific serine/threonine protein kinase